MIDLLGHLGYALVFAGGILLARKNRAGWLLRVAGGLVWTAIGITMGMSSIWVWGLLFLALDSKGYMSWR